MAGITRKLSYNEMCEFIDKNRMVIKKLYQSDLTAKKIAENQNIHFDGNWSKALLRELGPKGKGLGGARPGAGNKKGIKFCEFSGKKLSKDHACDTQ